MAIWSYSFSPFGVAFLQIESFFFWLRSPNYFNNNNANEFNVNSTGNLNNNNVNNTNGVRPDFHKI